MIVIQVFENLFFAAGRNAVDQKPVGAHHIAEDQVAHQQVPVGRNIDRAASVDIEKPKLFGIGTGKMSRDDRDRNIDIVHDPVRRPVERSHMQGRDQCFGIGIGGNIGNRNRGFQE